jgi:hypothetical protein
MSLDRLVPRFNHWIYGVRVEAWLKIVRLIEGDRLAHGKTSALISLFRKDARIHPGHPLPPLES